MIIGSVALKHWFPEFKREPKDLDTTKPLSGYDNLRHEVLINPVLEDWFNQPVKDFFCTPNELYTLKISHSFWALDNGSWDKHIYDISFLKEKGCVFVPELFTKLHVFFTNLHGKNKRSNLKMSAQKFFNNKITFPIPHDDVHELLIEHPYFEGQNSPTYSLILKDGAEVEVSEEKYNTLTERQKYNLVFEEVAVMAAERYGHLYYKSAYGRMLKKFIISHAPIWEAVWIIQNHKKLITTIPFNFLKHINDYATVNNQ